FLETKVTPGRRLAAGACEELVNGTYWTNGTYATHESHESHESHRSHFVQATPRARPAGRAGSCSRRRCRRRPWAGRPRSSVAGGAPPSAADARAGRLLAGASEMLRVIFPSVPPSKFSGKRKGAG